MTDILEFNTHRCRNIYIRLDIFQKVDMIKILGKNKELNFLGDILIYYGKIIKYKYIAVLYNKHNLFLYIIRITHIYIFEIKIFNFLN